MAAVQVLQAQRVAQRLADCRRAGRTRRPIAPEARHANAQRQRRKGKHRREQRDHQAMRKDGVEAARRRLAPQRALHGRSHGQEEGQRGRQRRRQHEAVALVQPPQRGRPSVVRVGAHAHPGHRLRHVDGKFVWRRVLAGVQAGTAAVAQVGQVVDVGRRKLQPPRHRRKHRAEALAVAAGVADLHLPPDFCLGHQQLKLPHGGLPSSHPQPRPRRCARTRCRWSCPRRPCSPGPAHCRP